MGSRWLARRRGWHEVARLTHFAIAPDEDQEALAGCNDVAALKAWVVHRPLIRSCGVRLVGWRIRRLRTRVRNEFLGPAAGVPHALLPLLTCQGGVRKILRILRVTVPAWCQ